MIHILNISSEDLNNMLHDLTRIAHCIAGVDAADDCKRMLHSCEMELCRIRQTLLESIEDGN
jgi:hypothetical protein